MLKKTYTITNMECPNCAMILESIEDKLPGIKEINASYVRGDSTPKVIAAMHRQQPARHDTAPWPIAWLLATLAGLLVVAAHLPQHPLHVARQWARKLRPAPAAPDFPSAATRAAGGTHQRPQHPAAG